MTERPILMSAPMVCACLDGTKTQTRRVVKRGHLAQIDLSRGGGVANWSKPMPYGQPGDRLWVREAFRFTDVFDADSPARVGERCVDAGYRNPWAPLQFEADGQRTNWQHTGTPPHDGPPKPGKLRPGIHMPRWASRITLEVTGVRVERLQDISEADAKAEGCARLYDDEPGYVHRDEPDRSLCPQCGGTRLYTAFNPTTGGALPDTDCMKCDTYVKRYQHLWTSINGPDSWAANPYVWVISFKRI